MKSRLLAVLATIAMSAVSVQTESRTATQKERAACEARIQPKIDAIDSRLRGGYSASEGEKLKERRRRLVEQRDACSQA